MGAGEAAAVVAPTGDHGLSVPNSPAPMGAVETGSALPKRELFGGAAAGAGGVKRGLGAAKTMPAGRAAADGDGGAAAAGGAGVVPMGAATSGVCGASTMGGFAGGGPSTPMRAEIAAGWAASSDGMCRVLLRHCCDLVFPMNAWRNL